MRNELVSWCQPVRRSSGEQSRGTNALRVSPKGFNSPAQGNALRKEAPENTAALKGRKNSAIGAGCQILPPLQGLNPW